MSRRRGEFEHRTSIFEGAFRAWSHLGGLEPLDLENKPASELDPLVYPIENDPRLNEEKKEKDKGKKKDGDNDGDGDEDVGHNPDGSKRREYPYEPLPRSGLAHPFVQAILSPWLGPDADQDAIQLGLTTLRTWWQHRRKGESGSAIVALGTEKMRGVVEGYTRHFFNLAHCLIMNDKEQPPRTLQAKMRDLEKSRNKKSKKRNREDESVKIAAMAFNSGFGGGQKLSHDGGGQGMNGMNPMGGGGGMGGGRGGAMPQLDDNLSPLERLHAAQRRQLAESGGVHSNLPVSGMGENHAMAAAIEMKGRCIPGKVDLPGLVQQVSSSATQLAHRGMINQTPDFMGSGMQQNVDPSKYGDPNVTPVVLVGQNGDIQFFMRIDGITCAHCVKIVETVLKGCQGNRSPIDGLLDAAADREMNIVLIKIEKGADPRRIAHEATRNLSMVGYTAKAKSLNINDVSKGRDVDLDSVSAAFEVMPNINPLTVFNWNLDCACPDNGILRQDCPRHSQMNHGIIEVFNKTERLVSELIIGCGKKFGMPCTAGNFCFCHIMDGNQNKNANSNNNGMMQENNGNHQNQQFNNFNNNMNQGNNQNQGMYGGQAGMSYQQPIQDGPQGNDKMNGGQMGGTGRMPRMSLGGLGRHMSLTSETTFGRAMSGLSALSIDWENMEDFDINVDHSAHINNDVVNNQQNNNNQQQYQNQNNQLNQNNLPKEEVNGMMGGHDMTNFGQNMMNNAMLNGMNNGMPNGMNFDMMMAGMRQRRSSLRQNMPIDPNAALNNVSFNM